MPACQQDRPVPVLPIIGGKARGDGPDITAGPPPQAGAGADQDARAPPRSTSRDVRASEALAWRKPPLFGRFSEGLSQPSRPEPLTPGPVSDVLPRPSRRRMPWKNAT